MRSRFASANFTRRVTFITEMVGKDIALKKIADYCGIDIDDRKSLLRNCGIGSGRGKSRSVREVGA
jgi:hypothetical protein